MKARKTKLHAVAEQQKSPGQANRHTCTYIIVASDGTLYYAYTTYQAEHLSRTHKGDVFKRLGVFDE